RHRAGTHLDEVARGVRHQDEVVGGFENSLPLLALAVERALRLPGFGDVARGFRGADDVAGRRADRNDAERYLHLTPALVQPDRLVALDLLAAADPPEDIRLFGAPLRLHDEVDLLPDGF